MIELSAWEQGICFAPDSNPELRMYLWFYEWNLFDAVQRGAHTPGLHDPVTQVDRSKSAATLEHPGLQLEVQSLEEGAELRLTIENRSDYPWHEVAAIIPCFNPGDPLFVETTQAFVDDEHERTWYLGKDAQLQALEGRGIHFNESFAARVAEEEDRGEHVFSHKWPTSDDPGTGGLILRESADGHWLAGIAWERFLSLQGHNPLRCMHQSVRVGPLAPRESRAVRGRVYLFSGSKEQCRARFQEDFPQR